MMGPVMISARHRLSWTPSSPKFFLLSEVSFHRCAETPRRRTKSTRRRAASSSPPSSCLSKVRSPSPYTQPSRELFGLKIPNCSFFFRAARGSWSCSTVLQWRSRWSSMGARGMPGRPVPQNSLSLALLGQPRWWLLPWLEDGSSGWLRMACWCCAPSVLRMMRPRCRDSRSMYRLSRTRGRHHFSMR